MNIMSVIVEKEVNEDGFDDTLKERKNGKKERYGFFSLSLYILLLHRCSTSAWGHRATSQQWPI